MEIMKAHQGSINIDDNPGGGIIFTLRFGYLMSQQKKKSAATTAGARE